MKQLIQNFKTGELGIFDVPTPICQENGILVETTVSLVSAGTEKMLVDFAKKSILSKAKDRPDLVKQVIDKMKREGIKNTLNKVFTKLETPIPLGYSLAGRVIKVGSNIRGTINIGDRVACGGAGYANHSEINYIPKNLTVKIPNGVDDIDASFVTVGAIALQGIRQCEPKLGEKITVIGLGLLGQLTIQLLKANGCKVIGSDIEPDKIELAKKMGADEVCSADDLIDSANKFSNGYGVDAVIITASTQSNQPTIVSAEIVRMRGRVIFVGMVGMNIPRNEYYKKEIEIRLSMAYGAGRYDPQYEERGIDYPYDLVRWTEQRNFDAFLGLIEEGKVNPKALITHSYSFDNAIKAYQLLEGKLNEKYLGVLLKYKGNLNLNEHRVIRRNSKVVTATDINIGLIGAGNFTKSTILPTIERIPEYKLIALATATGVTAESIGKKYNFKYITTDSDSIFLNNDINSIIIAARHNRHASLVIEAIKHNKHCFVEKPLSIYEHELEEIYKLYNDGDNCNSIIQVGFNRRFSPMVKQIKRSIDGTVAINYRINAGVIPKDSWIQERTIGGGRVIGEVCHFIDTCSYLTGSEVVSLYATVIKGNNHHSIIAEDNINIILNYANGSVATIAYYAYGNSSMPKERIEIFGNGISMEMNDFRELIIYHRGKIDKYRVSNQDKGFKNEFKAFRDAIKSGTPAIPFSSIYNTTKTAFKILISIEKGEPICF
jgi:predicted dehydrogenase